jgi:hypothetical protein
MVLSGWRRWRMGHLVGVPPLPPPCPWQGPPPPLHPPLHAVSAAHQLQVHVRNRRIAVLELPPSQQRAVLVVGAGASAEVRAAAAPANHAPLHSRLRRSPIPTPGPVHPLGQASCGSLIRRQCPWVEQDLGLAVGRRRLQCPPPLVVRCLKVAARGPGAPHVPLHPPRTASVVSPWCPPGTTCLQVPQVPEVQRQGRGRQGRALNTAPAP